MRSLLYSTSTAVGIENNIVAVRWKTCTKDIRNVIPVVCHMYLLCIC